MAAILDDSNTYAKQIASARSQVNPVTTEVRTPPAPGVTPGPSPRTPDAAVSAYAAELGAPPSSPAARPTIMATPPGPVPVSPQTPAGPIAAYAANLGARGPAPAAPTEIPGLAGGIVNVAGDVASAYNTGAQTSTATGVGMGAREAVISPVSRAAGALMDAGKSIYNSVGRPLAEGVRAFVSGQPPMPAAATATPSVATVTPPAARAAAAPGVPQISAMPQAGVNGASPGWVPGQVQVGGLTITDTGTSADGPAHRLITGDGGPEAPSVRMAASPGLRLPGRVESIASPARQPRTALGGLLRTGAGLAVVKGENNMEQRDFKNTVAGLKAMEGMAKTNADLQQSAANTERTGEETKKLKAENKNAVQIQGLRDQLLAEKDPAKRKELENKLNTLQGKKQTPFQVVTAETIDPATGLAVKTPYVIDPDTGQSRPLTGAAGGAQAGMQYIGKSPQGKRIFQDAQGNKHVEG